MRQFSVRWWVVNPLERYKQEIAALNGDEGISVRFVKESTPENVRFEVTARFLSQGGEPVEINTWVRNPWG